MTERRCIGVLVNPIAGLGGRAGFKGTDAPELAHRAREMGVEPVASHRMAETLFALATMPVARTLEIITAPDQMGELAARDAGFSNITIVGRGQSTSTVAADTIDAARAMVNQGVALIVFAGGDGTARDMMVAVATDAPVIGVPAGVKMHSAIFAASPRSAAALLERFLAGRTVCGEHEVMDIDEEAYRNGVLTARLLGYLRGPAASDLVQGPKVAGVAGDVKALGGIARTVGERLVPGMLLILGPGTTTRAVAQYLGVKKTLLGVDLIRDGKVIKADSAEANILEALRESPSACIAVAPIGGQGHILGRGNQQISTEVIARVGVDHIIVLATPAKLASLSDGCLRVDTGDAALDKTLSGYRRVITGFRCEAIFRVSF